MFPLTPEGLITKSVLADHLAELRFPDRVWDGIEAVFDTLAHLGNHAKIIIEPAGAATEPAAR